MHLLTKNIMNVISQDIQLFIQKELDIQKALVNHRVNLIYLLKHTKLFLSYIYI